MTQFKILALYGLMLAWLAACAPPPQHGSHEHNHDHGATTAATNDPAAITIDQLRQKMEQGTAIVFIDTRNELAWQTSETQIPGSIRISNNEQLAELVKELPKDSFIVAYCT